MRLHIREKPSDVLATGTKPVKRAPGFHPAIPVSNGDQCDQILITISATVSAKLVCKNPYFYRVCERIKKRPNRPYGVQICSPYPNTLLAKRTIQAAQGALMGTIFGQNPGFSGAYHYI